MSVPAAGSELSPETYAERAARAHRAMRRWFVPRRGIYRREGRLHRPGTAAHLWPFIRAFVATLDLAGAAGDFDAEAAIAEHLAILERYWDPEGPRPAYASDVQGTRIGGDRYYDDNAWVGLALVQLERMRPGSGQLARAADLFAFALQGWDRRPDVPAPGGVFWVEQGRGTGRGNHDRNTVSTAPNAQVGLHLGELAGAVPSGPAGPEEMHGWVERTLATGTGLYWDKIRGDGSIDRAEWSYNQGNMIGLKVLLARARGDRGYVAQAEAIARAALVRYAGAYEQQPAAFNAILFRNLLQLHAASQDDHLRGDVLAALRAYADQVWGAERDNHGCVRLNGGRATLLDQSAVVSVHALLAWDAEDYRLLA